MTLQQKILYRIRVNMGFMIKQYVTIFFFFFFSQDRVLAAKAMIERLRQTQRAEIINDMETSCEAYISLANWDVEKYKKETSKGTFTLT